MPIPMQQTNGIIISATGSGCGKTTITAMLLAAFSQRKLAIQPYKIGADSFDCGLHCIYSNEISLNLDSWIMGKKNILAIINRLTSGYRGLIEGLGGLFQHYYPDARQGSTMEIAQLLNWPILLIVCCEEIENNNFSKIISMIEKSGEYNNKSRIAGVILNKVTNHQIADELSHYLAKHAIKVLGSIENHSSLNHPTEMHNISSNCQHHCPSIKKLSYIAEKYLKIDQIIQLSTPLNNRISVKEKPINISAIANKNKQKKCIAISDDNAFFFYYQDNHQFLIDHNVEIVKFSPLMDTQLPENLDGLILSGGIPEKYAKEITANYKLREDIKNKINNGLKCYAECGGLMLLSQGIYLRNGQFYPMVGCIPGIVEFTDKLQNHGYALSKTILNNKAISVRGYEYHYACWLDEEKLSNLWQTTTCVTNETRREGFKNENIHASFVHLYFPTAADYICDFFELNPAS